MLNFYNLPLISLKISYVAKLDSKDITIDWYKKAFMNEKLVANDIAINAGLNKKP